MGLILALLAFIIHISLCFAGAPLLWGVTARLRAWLRGRRGPSLYQPYRDLGRLLGKIALVPDTATDMFTLWPLVAFLALAVTVMLIPGFCTGMLTHGASDYVTVIGFFVLGRAAMMLGGLETGRSSGGAGVARMALSGLYGEATLLAVCLTFAVLGRRTNLDELALRFRFLHEGGLLSMGFALAAMLTVMVAVTGRSDARTQEPAMIREAMTLDYSGRQLAMLDYTAMLHRLAWMNLILCIFVPFGMARAASLLSWPGGLLVWGGKLICLSAGLVIFEVACVETALPQIPRRLGVALFLGLLASLFLMVVVRA